MALFGHAAEWWHGDARINPKDIKFQFFGFEGFGGGFDRTKIIKFEGKIFKLASRQGVVHQRLYLFLALLGLGFRPSSYVNFATCMEQNVDELIVKPRVSACDDEDLAL
ncbi:hypothetical protein ABVK25_007569 [Lepraria finkii]|uniref:Uncharacterized protein n=1 Tax=Lepraria finkii TaxID=1340010 RepID=A0ABR4B482_9LECA